MLSFARCGTWALVSPSRELEVTSSAPELAPRRSVVAGPVVAAVTALTALVATSVAGVPLRDPDGVVGKRLLLVFGLVGVLILLDVLVRAARRSGRVLPRREILAAVRRERWSLRRGAIVGSALVVVLRHLPGLPQPQEPPARCCGRVSCSTRQLAEVDRTLFGGNDPAALCTASSARASPRRSSRPSTWSSSSSSRLARARPGVLAGSARGLFYATALSYQLGARGGELLAAPLARADLRGTRCVRRAARTRRPPICRTCCWRPGSSTGDPSAGRRRPEHRGLRLPAHLDHLHRRDGGLAAGAGPAAADRAVGAAGAHRAATIYFGWHYVIDDSGAW